KAGKQLRGAGSSTRAASRRPPAARVRAPGTPTRSRSARRASGGRRRSAPPSRSGRPRRARAAEIEFRAEAIVDPLTGLLNRNALFPRFSELESQAAVSGSTVTLIACDLDHFER